MKTSTLSFNLQVCQVAFYTGARHAAARRWHLNRRSAIEDADRLRLLVRIGIAGSGDADLVVGELGVAAGEFDLGHVAGGAVVLRHGANLSYGGSGSGLCRSVAGEAFGVVVSLIVIDRLMGVVASEAADALVVADEALAVAETVRLEADERWATRVITDNCVPSAVTLPAEV